MRTTHKALISSFVTCCRKAFQTRGLSGCSTRQDQVRNLSPALTMVTKCKHYLLLLWTNLGTDDWSTRLSSSSHWPGPPEKRLFWKERKNYLEDNWLTRKEKTNSMRTCLTTNIKNKLNENLVDDKCRNNLVDEAHQVAVGPTSLVKFVIRSKILSDGSHKT